MEDRGRPDARATSESLPRGEELGVGGVRGGDEDGELFVHCWELKRGWDVWCSER